MNTLILGAGVSGVAAAHLAARLGHSVSVYDRSSQATIPLRAQDYTVHSGAWADRLLANIGMLVVSPGFPEHSEPIRRALAAGIEIISELEFGVRQLAVPYVAVTGTNGKTTVTTAIAEMLNASNVSAVAAGNIGLPVCGLGPKPARVVVLEASSFQLRFIDRFHPVAAGITNVAADHLDWHGTVTDYAAAKARIFENMNPDELLAYDSDDLGATTLAAQARCHTVPVSGTRVPSSGIGPEAGMLVIGDSLVPLGTDDPSFVADLGIAAAIAASVGADTAGSAGHFEASTSATSSAKRSPLAAYDSNSSKLAHPGARSTVSPLRAIRWAAPTASASVATTVTGTSTPAATSGPASPNATTWWTVSGVMFARSRSLLRPPARSTTFS